MQTHTRNEALGLGLAKYFTGQPCSKGHLGFRYTNTGACVGCIKGYFQKRSLRYRLNKQGRHRGYEPMVLCLHPDDHAAMFQFAEALNQARKLMD